MTKNKYIKNGYDCLEKCGNKVSRKGNRCNSCASKILKHQSSNCQCCSCRAKRGDFKGENNPAYGRIGKKHTMYGTKLEKIHGKTCNCPFCKNKRGELKGRRCFNYVDGRTPLTISIRNLDEYKQWRIKVFQRDNYKCQECGKQGGNLEAHHKKEFYKIFEEFLSYYSQFSPIEDKETLVRLSLSWKEFWDIENGQTLCEKCHNIPRVQK